MLGVPPMRWVSGAKENMTGRRQWEIFEEVY
jgi:hypothetical protein